MGTMTDHMLHMHLQIIMLLNRNLNKSAWEDQMIMKQKNKWWIYRGGSGIYSSKVSLTKITNACMEKVQLFLQSFLEFSYNLSS